MVVAAGAGHARRAPHFVPTATLVVPAIRSPRAPFRREPALRGGRRFRLAPARRGLARPITSRPPQWSTPPRRRPARWTGRRLAYGTSAGALARRHPGRLAPARVSGWSLAAIGLVAMGRPAAAAASTGFAAARLTASWHHSASGRLWAVSTAARRPLSRRRCARAQLPKRVVAARCDGTRAVAASSKPAPAPARTARLVVLLMTVPVLVGVEFRELPDVNPVAYAALRLLEDAAYGTGVAVGSFRERTLVTLVPEVRFPGGCRPAHGYGT